MRSTGPSRVVGISGSRVRPPTARRSATTTTSPTLAPGSSPASANRRSYTKSRSISSTSIPASEATSNHEHAINISRGEAAAEATDLAAGRARRSGQNGAVRCGRHFDRHVFPRDARRPQRGSHLERGGSGRLRLGLSGRHLWHVWPRGEWPPAWSKPKHDRLPATYEVF